MRRWYKKIKRKFGAWLCRKEWHKLRKHVGIEIGHINVMTVTEMCDRCHQLTALDCQEVGQVHIKFAKAYVVDDDIEVKW